MICSICNLDDGSVKDREVIGGADRLAKTSVMACDYCASFYKDTPTPRDLELKAEKAREEAYESLKPARWPAYAKWPLTAADVPPPGWALTSDGWREILS